MRAGICACPSFSADGCHIVFTSEAAKPAAGDDAGNRDDVFLRGYGW